MFATMRPRHRASQQLVGRGGSMVPPPPPLRPRAWSPFREVPVSASSDPVFGLVGGWRGTEHLSLHTGVQEHGPFPPQTCVVGEGVLWTELLREGMSDGPDMRPGPGFPRVGGGQ